MKYTHNAVMRAEKELDERRKKAEEEQVQREKEVSEAIPEIATMRKTLKDSYFTLIKQIAAHEPGAVKAASLVRDKNIATQERIAMMLEMYVGDRDYLDVKYTCPKCRDTGYIEGERCECLEELMKKYTIEELNESSAIGLHDFSEYRSDYYSDEEQRVKMDEYLKKLMEFCELFPAKRASYIFIGGTGLGKTFISSCIVKALGERGIPVTFVSAFDMLRILENEHYGHGATADTMEKLISTQLLIIDDLGAEMDSPIYRALLYNVLNGRINRGMSTIISTNLEPDALTEKYHERLASRILSECSPMVFKGSDIRMQLALKRMNET